MFAPGAMRSMVFGSNATFQPLGALLVSSISSAGAVPVLVTTIGIEASLPASARALSTPSRPAMLSCGWPVISSATLVSAEASSAEALTETG